MKNFILKTIFTIDCLIFVGSMLCMTTYFCPVVIIAAFVSSAFALLFAVLNNNRWIFK